MKRMLTEDEPESSALIRLETVNNLTNRWMINENDSSTL